MVWFLWLLCWTLWDIQPYPPVWDVISVTIMLIWHLSQKPESITTHSLLTLFNNYLENRLRLSHSGDHMITWFTWALIKASGAGDVIPWSPLKPLRCVTVLLSLTAKNHLNGEIHVCDVFIITNEWICPDYFMETRENCGLEDRLWGRKHACLADVVSWVEKQNIFQPSGLWKIKAFQCDYQGRSNATDSEAVR